MSRPTDEHEHGWLRPDGGAGAPAQGLEWSLTGLWESVWRQQPEHVLRGLPGRLTFVWPGPEQLRGARWIVKRFEREAWGECLYELRRARRRSAAQRECESLLALEALAASEGGVASGLGDRRDRATAGLDVPRDRAMAGLDVPRDRAIAGLDVPRDRAIAGLRVPRDRATSGLRVPRALGWAAAGARSFLLLEWVEHVSDLRERVRSGDPAVWRRCGAGLLAAVVQLHASGWYHRDLYLQHWLVTAADELVLIDLGRARHERQPRRRWFEKDLAALLHSTPAVVPHFTRLRFLVGYLRARSIGGRADGGGRAGRRAELVSWARAIERRRARMAAHRPRYGESPLEVGT